MGGITTKSAGALSTGVLQVCGGFVGMVDDSWGRIEDGSAGIGKEDEP